jgi:hypothetical protein
MEYLKTIMKVFESINSKNGKKSNLLPTELYNESWMLRLILHWFNKDENRGKRFKDIPISMNCTSSWFSEGRLGTVFPDEKYTRADGTYGDIIIGDNGYSDVKLVTGCSQFVITEAKMFSTFSHKITKYSNYNQAARNIVCMCHIVEKSKQEIDDIAFYTLLPQSQIDGELTFKDFTNEVHIKKTVTERIEKYKNDNQNYENLLKWYKNVFIPFFTEIKIELISWEKIIEVIFSNDLDYGKMLKDYYNKCIIYNQKNKNIKKQNENKYGRGVKLIYCKELFPNSCVHFSWAGNSCRIRDYKNENEMSLYQYSTEVILDKKPKVIKSFKMTDRERTENIKWWYDLIQECNKEVKL